MSLRLLAAAIDATATSADAATESVVGLTDAAQPDLLAGLSKGLRTLLDFEGVEPVGLSDYPRALEILQKFSDLLAQNEGRRLSPQAQTTLARDRQSIEDYFRRFFPQLGTFDRLLRDWQTLHRRMEEAERKKSQTATRAPAPTTTSTPPSSTSLIILQRFGGLP